MLTKFIQILQSLFVSYQFFFLFYSLFVSYQPIYLTKSQRCGYLSSINRLTYNTFHGYILKIDTLFLGLRDVDYSIYHVIVLVKFF